MGSLQLGTDGAFDSAAALLDLSYERDLHQHLRVAAWRDGYRAGQASMAGEYERGMADGILAYKAAQHNVVRDLRQHLRTWDGLRTRFGDPRPGDFRGRGAAA